MHAVRTEISVIALYLIDQELLWGLSLGLITWLRRKSRVSETSDSKAKQSAALAT